MTVEGPSAGYPGGDAEPLDGVAAVVAVAELLGTPAADAPLRRRLPGMGDPDRHGLAILAGAAGLVPTPFSCRAKAVRPEHCPFVMRAPDGTWHAIAEIAHGGLAVRIAPDGASVPVSLDALAVKGRVEGNSLRAVPSIPSRGTADEEGGDRVRLGTLRSFIPSPRILLPVVAATLAINVLALAIPLATMNIFDRVISNAAFETLWALTAGVALALAFDFALRSLRAAVLDRGSARADVLALNAVFARMLGARMNAHSAPGTRGVGVQAQGLREYEGVRDYLNATSMAALGDVPFVALFLLVIWAVAGPLVVVPLLAVPLFLLTAFSIQLRLRRAVEGQIGDAAHKNAVATESLHALESLKLSGGEAWAAGRWERAVASQLRHSLGVRRLTALSLHLVTLFQGVTTIAVLVVGVYLVADLAITPGALFAANLLAGRCLAPLAAVASLLARFHQSRMAARTVARLAAMEPERPASRRLVDPTRTWGSTPPAIELANVRHAYARPDGEPGPNALCGVSLTVRPGERVAVVGGIGSGKSTLLRLMTMLDMPSEGRVLIGSVATTDLDPDAWRARIGALPQTPGFVAGTVRDNVALGRWLTDEAVVDALRLSGAADWLPGTGMGLDTPIGERGLGLSGGQLQTVALARALVGRPPVLLLDEPTSHLDGRAEAAVAARIAALSGTTTITVTHRPALIETADRLIVMDRGRVKLDGPRAEVTRQLREMAASAAATGKGASGRTLPRVLVKGAAA